MLISSLKGRYPSYFIYGPLVFSPVSNEFVSALDRTGRFYGALALIGSPLALRRGDLPKFEGEELVVVSSPMFPHRIGKGYDDPFSKIIKEVNGIRIKNLRHLRRSLARLEGEVHAGSRSTTSFRRRSCSTIRRRSRRPTRSSRTTEFASRHPTICRLSGPRRSKSFGMRAGALSGDVDTTRTHGLLGSDDRAGSRPRCRGDCSIRRDPDRRPGPGWASTAVCPTFAGTKGSGGPIRLTSGWGSTLSRWRTRAGSRRIPTLAWGFYGHRMELYRRTDSARGVSRFCGAGPTECAGRVRLHLERRRALSASGFCPRANRRSSWQLRRDAMHERLRGGDLPGRADPSRDRPGDDAGGSALAGVSRVWGAGAAEYLDVRGFRVELRADRRPDAPDEGLAGRTRTAPSWRSSSAGQGGRFRRCEWSVRTSPGNTVAR